MQQRGKRRALLSVIIAAVLVIALLIAGTALRMQSRDMAPLDAFRSFVSDTFGFK